MDEKITCECGATVIQRFEENPFILQFQIERYKRKYIGETGMGKKFMLMTHRCNSWPCQITIR